MHILYNSIDNFIRLISPNRNKNGRHSIKECKMSKSITVNCSLENFKDKSTEKEVTYVKLTSNVLGVTIRLKPYDSTTAEVLKAYLTSK